MRNNKYADLTGMKFGKLLVIKRAEDYTYIIKKTGKIARSPQWLCDCDCGNEATVLGRRLRDGTKSCGCLQKEYAEKYEDLSGQKFGKLTVIKMSHKEKQGEQSKIYWECKCDCGNTDYVNSGNLKSGVVKSCGCETLKNLTNLKHGKAGTRLYTIFTGMKERCYNSNVEHYKYYGGKGVYICDEWLSDFMNFYNWSISNGYNDKLTIDRINNNGIYEPDNCRWATYFQQMNNTSRNIYIKINEEIISISDLCRKYKLDYKQTYYNVKVKMVNIKEYLLGKGCDVNALSIQVL